MEKNVKFWRISKYHVLINFEFGLIRIKELLENCRKYLGIEKYWNIKKILFMRKFRKFGVCEYSMDVSGSVQLRIAATEHKFMQRYVQQT